MNSDSFFILALLLKCSTYAHNKYWEKVFENMSNKITPNSSITININSIEYIIDDKKYVYNIDYTDYKDYKDTKFKLIYKDIYTFLKKKIGIDSVERIDYDKEKFYMKQHSTESDWSCITKKSDILFYIEKYLCELKTECNVDFHKMVRFNKYIRLPFILKKVYNEIEYCPEQKKIINIKNIKIVDGEPLIIN